MRVAVFVVFVAFVPVLATPSEASRSCMTKTEARQHFGSVHIYWHGARHCWDATSMIGHHRVHQVQRKTSPPKWRESMSKMLPDEISKTLPDEEPVQKTWVNRWVDIEPPQLPMVERRADIAAPADITQPGPLPIRKPAPMLGGYRPGHAAARHRSQIRADGHAARPDDGDHRHHTDACNRRVSVHWHEIGRIHSQTALTTAEGISGT